MEISFFISFTSGRQGFVAIRFSKTQVISGLGFREIYSIPVHKSKNRA
ncbi:hypothetical protein C900_00738 [Fulvivirga imtechensis AK7]|uniref:Uncharacterized protein n=1 Tax=Fulvivirga imtechensis AK7 TaxID=1237149 RepID=L8JZZ6_9BACT|nr:hypothetical protein C900_00738 [Fulvivirga imtechensis AK7]